MSQRLRVVCEPCNNGWMSRLQSQTKPILLRLLNDNWSLTVSEQNTLAAWATMFSMVYQQVDPDTPMFALGERKHLLETSAPLLGWHFWLGKADLQWGSTYANMRHAMVWHPDHKFQRMFSVGFTVGSVVILAYFAEKSLLSPSVLNLADVFGVHKLWPSKSVISGQPKGTFNDTRLVAFTNHFARQLGHEEMVFMPYPRDVNAP